MAFLLQDSFPQADMNRVMRMCPIHNLDKIFTGDIPTFEKTAGDKAREEELLRQWGDSLPQPLSQQMAVLFAKTDAQQTIEARIYKVIDSLEAVVQHNKGNISTWIEREYSLNLTYGDSRVAAGPARRAAPGNAGKD